ncbi:hypothetical protein [Flavobacterium oreochromis]|uniref:hypothetical protein n=1 Tax=Flavobacterium oreochromis TaxID=2906078 RepID=UPI000B4DD55F|nr:hypothetical protein [Flavobacterium oreochromis]OWP76474.1 hypothetical protein BWG23_07695 [Flavobacterium oreochromis]
MSNKIRLKNNTLQAHLDFMNPRVYAVSVKYFDDKNPMPTKRIDYEAEIIITSNQGVYLLDIFKRAVWFDQHEPDLISEQISNELSQSLYPVQVRVDPQKMRLIEYTNYNQIVNRWYRNKGKVTTRYASKILSDFYSHFEKNLENRSELERSMEYDVFWNFLFHPNYIDYGNEHSVKTDFYLAIIPYQYPIQFKGIQTIDTHITNSDTVRIDFKSDEMLAAPYFIQEALKNKQEGPFYMQLEVAYYLDVYSLFPVYIRANFNVYTKNAQGIVTVIKRVEFSQYQQNVERNKKPQQKAQTSFLVEEKEEDQDHEIYKTYKGQNYTHQQWLKFEEEQYKIYKEKQKKRSFWDFWE